MPKLRFGVHLPNSGGGAVSPDRLVDYKIIRNIALLADKTGFDSVWANDHFTLPTEQASIDTKFYEPITLLSSLASATSKVTLGTAIVILPFRDPFALAKEVGLICEISGNRFILGVGPGRFEREYTAQKKNWAARNKIMEEQIRLIRELLSGKEVEFQGKYFVSEGFSMRPQADSLPIVLGGSGPQAVERACRLCDGIMPGHVTVSQAREISDSIQMHLKTVGNQNERNFVFCNEIILSIDRDSQKAGEKFFNSAYVRKVPYATDLSSKALIGNPDEVISKIEEYARAGVQEFIMIFADETERDFLESMNLFSAKVLESINR